MLNESKQNTSCVDPPSGVRQIRPGDPQSATRELSSIFSKKRPSPRSIPRFCPGGMSGCHTGCLHPPSAERRTIALCVLEMTRGRSFAPNVRAANERMRGTVANGRMGVWNPSGIPAGPWVGSSQRPLRRSRRSFHPAVRFRDKLLASQCPLGAATDRARRGGFWYDSRLSLGGSVLS